MQFKMYILKENSLHSETPFFQNLKEKDDSEKMYIHYDINKAKDLFTKEFPEKNLVKWCMENFMKDKYSFIDINADIGNYTLALATGMKKVYSFEHDMKKFTCLNSNILLHNLCTKVTPLPFKISNETKNDSGIITYKLDDFPFLESGIGFIKAPGSKVIFEGAKNILEKNNFPPILFTLDESNIAAMATKKDLFQYLENVSYKIVILNGVKDTFLAIK